MAAAKIDWETAWAYYLSLGPRRSFREVARRFQVSSTAVSKHAAKADWKRRAKRHDAETRRRVEREMVRTRAERTADLIRLADASRIKYARQLADPNFAVRGSDVAAFARLEALFEDQAAGKIDVVELNAYMSRVAETALHFVPIERHADFIAELEALHPDG
jgi:hypothetical protein